MWQWTELFFQITSINRTFESRNESLYLSRQMLRKMESILDVTTFDEVNTLALYLLLYEMCPL
jgi:hypothetical protein